MPELPEVETTKNILSSFITNAKVNKVEIYKNKLRWPINEEFKLDFKNSIILNPFRLGKYILIPTNKNKYLLIHLGMSGFLKIIKTNEEVKKHDHIKFTFINKKNKKIYVFYNDTRRFGFIDYFNKKDLHKHFLLKKLGVEPLSSKLNQEYFLKKIKNKNIPIKTVLLDQSIIAGIGNIYASEILFLSKIHPLLISKFVNYEIATKLCIAIKKTLNEAINSGGTTIRDFKNPDGKIGYFKNKLRVYSKAGEKCFDCTQKIKMINLSGRSTYFCEKCQSFSKKFLKEI